MIGQDRAKKVMSVAVYNHYKRLANNLPGKDFTLSQQKRSPTGIRCDFTGVFNKRRLDVTTACCECAV